MVRMHPQFARHRILGQFLLGIALPALLLSYFAVRGIRNDRALVERERREDLERVAAAAGAALEERLARVEVALDDIARSASSSGAEAIATAVPAGGTLLRIDASGDVEIIGPAYVPRVRHDWSATPPLPSSTLAEAQRRERAGDTRGAIAAYEHLSQAASSSDERAHARAGLARSQRSAGDVQGAATTYHRLLADHGADRTSGGIPYGIAARLELASMQLESGDTTGLSDLAELHRNVLSGAWQIDRAQLAFLTGRIRETMTSSLARSDGASVWTDSAAALAAQETRALERMSGLDAARDALARTPLANSPSAQRFAVDAGASQMIALLRTTAATGERWGALLDPSAFRDAVLIPAVTTSASAAEAVWRLETPFGDTASNARGGTPVVHASLPAPFSNWRLELRPREPGLAEALLTSRRGIYFYAFVLLAGIFAFGLTLTIRSVNHELRLARMQADFISTVSHEFKSPLTAIRQLTEMLQAERVPSEERRRHYYSVLLEQAERLSALMDNVLDFARMDEGKRMLDLEVLDPGDVLEQATSLASGRSGHSGFRIRTISHGPLPMIRADRDALLQALGNLLDNAIKYSGDARDIEISAVAEAEHVAISVSDHGIGLTDEDARRVFDRFFRAGDPLTRSVKGTGLGLTLVRQIVEAHNGTVAVRSEPGRGSTFIIRLPAEPAPLRTTLAEGPWNAS